MIVLMQELLGYIEVQHKLLQDLGAVTQDCNNKYNSIFFKICSEIIKLLKLSTVYPDEDHPTDAVNNEEKSCENMRCQDDNFVKTEVHSINFISQDVEQDVIVDVVGDGDEINNDWIEKFENEIAADYPASLNNTSELKTTSDLNEDEPSSEKKKLSRRKKKSLVSCDICEMTFTQNSHLLRHKRSVHDIVLENFKTYKCRKCNITIKSIEKLRQHYVISPECKPFQCEFCGKRFPTKGGHKRHTLNIHVSPPPPVTAATKQWQCHLCSNKFTQQAHLKTHMILHTGLRPFECGICKYAFTQKSHLTNHLKIHTGDKRFECDICHKKFYRRTHVTGHKKRMHK